MNLIRSAATGNYQVIGNPKNADSVIGFSFGAREKEPGLVNDKLAQFVLDRYAKNSMSLIMQHEIADAFPDAIEKPDKIIYGELSTNSGKGLDSYGVLEQASEYMLKNGLERPILVAQAHHIGRAAIQAAMFFGSNIVVPEDLPKDFDPESLQLWTRNKYLWMLREMAGMGYLKYVNKL